MIRVQCRTVDQWSVKPAKWGDEFVGRLTDLAFEKGVVLQCRPIVQMGDALCVKCQLCQILAFQMLRTGRLSHRATNEGYRDLSFLN